MSAPSDSVQDFLADRGCAEHVVAGGLEGLIDAWETFAKGLGKGYAHGLDDYLNDLDLRQIIAEAWLKATATQRKPLTARLAAADKRVRAATTASAVCLWGSKNAKKYGWDASTHWWYFAVPKKPAADLQRDLGRVR
jgi:hypothetical protein